MTPTAAPLSINDHYAPEKSGPEILTLREATQLLLESLRCQRTEWMRFGHSANPPCRCRSSEADSACRTRTAL